MAKRRTTKLADLKLDPENARRRTERGEPLLQKSLEQFGAARSVVIDGDGIVRAGNGTVEAAIAAGLVKVKVIEGKPDELVVVRRGDLKGEEAKAYAIADNRTGELAEWDLDELEKQLEGLAEFSAEDLGFDEDDLSELFPEESVEPEDVEPQIDRAEELAEEWGTAENQLWIIEGQQTHRLLCGDSTKAEDVERLMGGEKADCLLIDPPYGINANKQTLGTGKKEFHRGEQWDSDRPDLSHVVLAAEQAIIWGGNYFADQLPVTNGWLCWHKKNDGLSYSEFELAWTNLDVNCRHLSHHWSGEVKSHPTQKPLSVIAWCMGMTVGSLLDLFAGSGTTMLAAEQLNRRCYGIEISPKYCAVILQRMKDAGCTCKLQKKQKKRQDSPR